MEILNAIHQLQLLSMAARMWCPIALLLACVLLFVRHYLVERREGVSGGGHVWAPVPERLDEDEIEERERCQ